MAHIEGVPVNDSTTGDALCSSRKERLRQGDETALAEVMDAYAPRLAAAVRFRYPVFDDADVDDVLAVAFFRLWQGRRRLEPASGRLSTLLCRIAFHVAREVCRYSWHKARQLEVPIDWLRGTEPAAKPDHAEPPSAVPCQRTEDLRRIIDGLPDSYRQIVLADVAARDRVASADYLAGELDVAPGTVRVYRTRAYAAIRVEMRKLGYELP